MKKHGLLLLPALAAMLGAFALLPARGGAEAAEPTRAGVKTATCSVGFYEGEGPDTLFDDNMETKLSTTAEVYTISIELDDYYRLTGFDWLCFDSRRPQGSISYSLNGAAFTKWTDFAFGSDNTKMQYTGETVEAKYLIVDVTGPAAGVDHTATCEFKIWGEKFTPAHVDPQGITIEGKSAEGAYQEGEVQKIGTEFTLSAVQTNPASIESVKWESPNPAMLQVSEFGAVKVLRGGKRPYYTVRASVTAPNGTVYSDEIKIYIEPVTNVAMAGEITWSGVPNGFFGEPTKAFNGITGVWGDWVQPQDGTTQWRIKCDFKQPIPLATLRICIAVNPPQKIRVLGIKEGGSEELVKEFASVSSNSTLTHTSFVSPYTGLVFEITERSSVSTIYEIEVYNDASFDLGTLKNPATAVSEERGPTGSGSYRHTVQESEPSVNVYGDRFQTQAADPLFVYGKAPTTALYVLTGVFAGGAVLALIFGLVILFKKRGKKE